MAKAKVKGAKGRGRGRKRKADSEDEEPIPEVNIFNGSAESGPVAVPPSLDDPMTGEGEVVGPFHQFQRKQLLLGGSGQGLPDTNPSLMLAKPNSMKWSPKASGRITLKGLFGANAQNLMMILNLAPRTFFVRLGLILKKTVLFPVCRCDQRPRHPSLRHR